MFCEIFITDSAFPCFEINIITPCEEIPIRNFTVLYWDHVVALAKRLVGLSINASKESMMMTTFVLKCFRKHNGVISHNC